MTSSVWKQLGVADSLLAKLKENGIEEPTQVQAEAIPLLLEGKSLSARSQTGTGKTLAYLLPLLQKINAASAAVQAVVLSPTQELAMQIVRVAEAYGEPLGVRSQGLIGGAALKRQVERLKKHPQLVVGTPGRIHELIQMRKLKLSQASVVIIDEADQVFSLGSVKEVEQILWATAPNRQLAFFSATYPPQMVGIEGRWMKDAVRIHIEPQHLVSPTIEHYYLISDRRDKTDIVRRLVRMLEPKSALLFLNDTNNISNWESKLSYEGFTVETLYGDADKQRRAATLARFRDGRCQLLLATDVAARGIDIDNLPLVIQIDPAADADHYVHRAGRTGRMGKPGTVVSIVTFQERFIMDKFSKALKIELPEKTMYKGKLTSPEAARSGGSPAKGGVHSANAPRTQAERDSRRGGNYAGGENREGRSGGANAAGQRREPAAASREGRFETADARDSRVGRVRKEADWKAAGTAPRERSAAGEAHRRQRPAETGETAAIAGVRSQPKPGAASQSRSQAQPAKAKAERHKNRKDKGAPKWLKAKRESGDSKL
ncbi:DEAD/DEAH box helicase [Paenibacillus protaetiae]|uniref:DEAD/DEAH box helicase n=1 Tax=Paenibacillus protaetiae TaxID=2509456 RepID=A0A4P6EVE8_9BACL|nr:DEAD/DEAH box helicase [Paenibacillus protaetiae]QAY66616.1 DEAD/DEAH box helicase [Paenibacillus protaetiae]